MLNSTVTQNSVRQIMQCNRELSIVQCVSWQTCADITWIKSVKFCTSASVSTVAVSSGYTAVNVKSCVVHFIVTVRTASAHFVICNLYLPGTWQDLHWRSLSCLIAYEDVFIKIQYVDLHCTVLASNNITVCTTNCMSSWKNQILPLLNPQMKNILLFLYPILYTCINQEMLE